MKQKEQSNTTLYVIVFVGLIVIGALKAGFAYLFTADFNLVSYLIVEMVGIALVLGLILFVVQQLTGRSEKIGDELEMLNNEMEKLRATNEKLLASTAAGNIDRSKLPSQRAAAAAATPIPAPTPVAPVVEATPPPPPPKPKTPEEILEEQLEQEIEAIHFDNIFAEYEAEQQEARARGVNLDDDDGGTFISG